MSISERVAVYDTTLRDGAQHVGVWFSNVAKLRLVRKLDAMGIDYIEGGFAGSSKKDGDFFKRAADVPLSHARVTAFGATRRAGTAVGEDEGVRMLVAAGTPTVTIFGKSWELHVRDVLRTTARENLAMIVDTVKYLKDAGKEVMYDAEHFFDGFKASADFALETVGAAVDAGCDGVILCDTNGGSLPHDVHDITARIVSALSVPVGIHAHNDGGVAVANSLEAVRAGARHVQGTINGFGERCGNANLCSILPGLKMKMRMDCVSDEAIRGLRDVACFVDDLVNLRHNDNQPYVGANAFAHKAGMHVNAVEKNPATFEHIDPAAVGNTRVVMLSEGSGRSSVLLKAIEMGVTGVRKSSSELSDVVAALKDLENRGYAFEAADASFRMLVQKILQEHKPFFELEGFRVIVEKRGMDEPCLSEATIKVRVREEVEHMVGEGKGPVEALDHALRRALAKFYPEIAEVLLRDFRVRILDPEEATAATTRVLIESSDGKTTWGTVGVSQNIIEASWEALVDSLEYKLFKDEEERASGPGERSAEKRDE
jgi:2-isopropylmalate synthase